MNDSEKAAALFLEFRKFVDDLREKYGKDWCQGRFCVLASASPLDAKTNKSGNTGLAAMVAGSNILLEQMIAGVATTTGKAYEEAENMPEGTGHLLFFENIRKNLDGIKASGFEGHEEEKGYRILEE